jgi:TolB-like protein/Tfp pilus assembly protein PilF
MSLFAELKRRKVFKVGAGYVVVAWLAIQVGTSVLPIYGTPDWFLRAFVLVLMLGFPVALVLAWMLEVTPEGVKVDSGPVGNKRMVVIAAVLAALALGWYFHGLRSGPSADLGNARSIAVLPFVNMSGDQDNQYFSDGISEEILNVLAEIPELKVAARTSSFSFRGSKEEVPQIARQLGVRMVLEGSVRKQSDRVRITAQLIDSSTGYHVWSQTYDRELKDIFAIQDEIAKSIGEELKLRVAGEGKVSHRGTENLQAYDLYLRGLAQWQIRGEANLFAAKETFEKAIAADPNFAQAWAGLALVHAVLPEYTARITYEQSMSLGREAAERALLLDPTMPEPYAALGQFERYAQHQATAIALTERALALRPSFATAHHWLGTALVPAGEIERGLAASKRATELDPRSVIDASNYASMLMIAGRNADAIAACKPTLEYAPDSILCYPIIGMVHLIDGDLDQARHYYQLFVAHWNPQESGMVDTVFDALAGHGDRHAIAVRLSKATRDEYNDPNSGMPFTNLDIPPMLVLLGEHELVYQFIGRQAPTTLATLAWILLTPVMDPVRCDPRFQGPLTNAGLKDLRAASVCKDKP